MAMHRPLTRARPAPWRRSALARLSGGVLTALVLAGMLQVPGHLLPEGARFAEAAPTNDGAFFDKFHAWCGVAVDTAPQPADPAAQHDPLTCLAHCLRAAPAKSPQPLMALTIALPLPPAGERLRGPGPRNALPSRHDDGPPGARAPPRA